MFQNLALKKGSDLRKLWSKIPDGIPFKIYMFNITNPMDVQVGKKPILTEIGPYFNDKYIDLLFMCLCSSRVSPHSTFFKIKYSVTESYSILGYLL